MEENLRQRCVYDVVGDSYTDEDEHIFFNYLYNMSVECLQKRFTLSGHCSHTVMKELGIEIHKVDQCIKDSFAVPADRNSYNLMFEKDRHSANKLGIVTTPAIAVNSQPYHGDLDAD